MSELDLWLKKADADSYYEDLGATKAQALKGYLNGKLPPKEVARKFIEGFDLEIPYNRHFREILTYLIPSCYETSDSRAHRKIVKLMVAMRNLRYSMVTGMHSKHEMDLRKETDLKTVLCELGRSSKNVINSVRAFCHPWILLPYRANTRILGLWCEVLAAIRHDCPLRPASNMEWINLNAFIARLAASDVCSLGPWRVKYLCNSFLKDEKVREDVLMLNVAVSAAVQHMIYSASKGFELSERTVCGGRNGRRGSRRLRKIPSLILWETDMLSYLLPQ